jgi:hydroxyacylglutathione hydrolase
MSTAKYSTFEVAQFPCLGDNYGYLIHDPDTGDTAAVDTPDAKTYQNELDKRGWKLSHIFCTHHHSDHTGGNLELKKDGVKVQVYGAEWDARRIPGIDVALKPDENVKFGKTEAKIIDVGGHTNGHIAYHFESDGTVFVGDALFPLGCGRMFEGTPSQFWASLQRLRSLPDETIVYCAHEYTSSNAKFAMSVEPGNEDLVARNDEIAAKRQRGEPTVPSLIGEEKKTNPFFRGDVSAEIRKNVGATESDSYDVVFGKIRTAKDNFRG